MGTLSILARGEAEKRYTAGLEPPAVDAAARVAEPHEVETTTSAGPAVPAGVAQVSEVAEETSTAVAATPPMVTVVPPGVASKPVPATVTTAPPPRPRSKGRRR